MQDSIAKEKKWDKKCLENFAIRRGGGDGGEVIWTKSKRTATFC